MRNDPKHNHVPIKMENTQNIDTLVIPIVTVGENEDSNGHSNANISANMLAQSMQHMNQNDSSHLSQSNNRTN